jgi:plastocyanin
MRRVSMTAVAVAALLAIAACSNAGTAGPASAVPSVAASAAASAQAGGPAVTMKDIAFSPTTTQAKVGETITWTNQDSVAHTVTLDDKSVDSGNVATNATYSHAFTQAGSFPYHCEIHKQMTGTIVVSG